MLIVKEVKTKKEIKDFVNFPLNLYKNNPYFVPPLYGDELKLFKKNNVYSDQAKSVFFNCYMDGKIVGRIQGILQYASNEKWHQKRVRFTRFDAINDQNVANMLFEELEKWAKKESMEEIVGPLGYSDLEREGLLIEGFEELSTFEEQYNFEYYKTLIENCGYQKEVDWVERKLYAPKEVDERIEKISSYMLKKYNLRYGYAKNTKDFLKRYSEDFFEILDKTYNDLYQTVPITKPMKKMLISSFSLIVNLKYVAVILDENDKVVCFGLCFPSIAKALQKSKGHLTPLAIIRVLKALKKPKIIDLGLIGVLPEYQMKGVSTTLIAGVLRMLRENGVEYAETNLNLETNNNIQNQWKVFDSIMHKRRRSFVKKI